MQPAVLLDTAVAECVQDYMLAAPTEIGRREATALLDLLNQHQIQVLGVYCSPNGQFVVEILDNMELELWQRPVPRPVGLNDLHAGYGSCWQMIDSSRDSSKIFSMELESAELLAAIQKTIGSKIQN